MIIPPGLCYRSLVCELSAPCEGKIDIKVKGDLGDIACTKVLFWTLPEDTEEKTYSVRAAIRTGVYQIRSSTRRHSVLGRLWKMTEGGDALYFKRQSRFLFWRSEKHEKTGRDGFCLGSSRIKICEITVPTFLLGNDSRRQFSSPPLS
jgi:hypothetical protein